jgi:hypothetical protein
MPKSTELARRTKRLRAPLVAALALVFAACDNADQLTSANSEEPVTPPAAEPATANDPTALTVEDTLGATDPSDPTGGQPIYEDDAESGFGSVEEVDDATAEVVSADESLASGASFSSAYRGGIPFGVTQLPSTLFGRYSGGLTNISPRGLIRYLEGARRGGTRVMLVFAGNEKYFQNRNRSFNFSMWKARINRYRGLNLTPYIKDGTIVGHRMIDEPHDPGNWGGGVVSRVQLEAMAKYSKSLWPDMATIVRSWPRYLKGYRYRYLDAAWAQYAARFGSVSSFLDTNIRDSKAAGLALVVGVNQLNGGVRGSGITGVSARGKYPMSAKMLRSVGSQLLADSYPCAFLNWMYNARYLGRSDIKSAMSYLAGKARNRSIRSCSGR